jgi:ankyrin repeat protein
MLPWTGPESKLVIDCTEDDFRKKLAEIGTKGYLGDCASFQLLHIFSFQGRPMSILILLDKGADLFATTDFGINALHLAAAGGDFDTVQFLLESGFDVNLQVKGGRQLFPLMFAARMGYEDVVKLLLERGADVNATDKYGNTALDHAVARQNEAIVKVLLHTGASTQQKNLDGWSPLHLAARSGDAAIVQMLLDYGAVVDATDSRGFSSLFRAVVRGHMEAVGILMRNGANPNLRSEDGWSPFAAAIRVGNERVVAVLLDYESDLESKVGKTDRTPLQLAKDLKFDKIVTILTRKGYYGAPKPKKTLVQPHAPSITESTKRWWHKKTRS